MLTGASDSSATITAVSGTFSTGHGSVMISSDGSYIYTPASGYAGGDTFSFQAQTAHASAGGSVTVTVKPIDDLSVVTPQTLSQRKQQRHGQRTRRRAIDLDAPRLLRSGTIVTALG